MPSEFKPSSQVTKQHPINFIKSFIFTIFLKIVKSCFHLLTGRSAIERLLQDYEKLQKERSLTGPTFQSLRRAKKDATKAEASNEDRSRVPEKDGSESRVAHTGETDPSTDCGISSLDRTMLAIKLYNELKSSKLKQLNQAAYFLNGQSTKNKKTSENNSSNLSFTSPEEVIETIDSLKVKKYSKNLSSSPNHSANIQNSNFNNNLRTEESITLCNLKNLVITCYNYGEVKRILKDIQYERYNKDDEDHERKLMEIWDNCCIEKLESRISKQWDYWSLGAKFLLSFVLQFSVSYRNRRFFLTHLLISASKAPTPRPTSAAWAAWLSNQCSISPKLILTSKITYSKPITPTQVSLLPC